MLTTTFPKLQSFIYFFHSVFFFHSPFVLSSLALLHAGPLTWSTTVVTRENTEFGRFLPFTIAFFRLSLPIKDSREEQIARNQKVNDFFVELNTIWTSPNAPRQLQFSFGSKCNWPFLIILRPPTSFSKAALFFSSREARSGHNSRAKVVWSHKNRLVGYWKTWSWCRLSDLSDFSMRAQRPIGTKRDRDTKHTWFNEEVKKTWPIHWFQPSINVQFLGKTADRYNTGQ